MKITSLILLFINLSLQSYSQVNVQIGNSNEIVYPLMPDDPNNFSELLPLEKIFCSKKIIGMGEATHGTKEFFTMKTKMFKFLATHCGYKIFSIETSCVGASKVNDYVLFGKGDVLSAMQGLYGAWRTEEIRDFIEWMHIYNSDKLGSEKLKFYGFDCQSLNWPCSVLSDYVRDNDPDNLAEFLSGISFLKERSNTSIATLGKRSIDKKTAIRFRESIFFIENWFKAKQQIYISLSGLETYVSVIHNIENLKQATLLIENPKYSSYFRDSCMAQNIRWIYEQDDSKVFVWAHNEHISKYEPSQIAQNWMIHKCIGGFLNTMFGKDYYNIGFVFNEGKFRAADLSKKEGIKEFTVPVYKKNSLTNALSLPGINAFFIDLRTSDNLLFSKTQSAYCFGECYSNYKRNSKKFIPDEHYDGLIYISNTRQSVAIPPG